MLWDVCKPGFSKTILSYVGCEVLEWGFVTDKKIKDSIQPDCVTPPSRCPSGWSGYTCDIAAAPVDSSATGGSKSHSSDHLYPKVSPDLLLIPYVCFCSCRHGLHRCPCASVAAAGAAGGWRHLVV